MRYCLESQYHSISLLSSNKKTSIILGYYKVHRCMTGTLSHTEFYFLKNGFNWCYFGFGPIFNLFYAAISWEFKYLFSSLFLNVSSRNKTGGYCDWLDPDIVMNLRYGSWLKKSLRMVFSKCYAMMSLDFWLLYLLAPRTAHFVSFSRHRLLILIMNMFSYCAYFSEWWTLVLQH